MSLFHRYSAAIEFVIVAAVFCFFVGPVGVLYAAGLSLLHAVIGWLAALMDTRTFAKIEKPDDSNQHESFADGYIDGWRSVLGHGAAVPAIPSYLVPAGMTDYEYGYEQGRAEASGE